MERFVVFACDGPMPAARAQLDSWTRLLTHGNPSWTEVKLTDSFCAFVLQDRRKQAGPLSGADATGEGLVIGALFERGHGRKGAVKALGPEGIRRLVRGDHSQASGAFWGDFTAIWRDGRDASISVHRDPCGATPCFHMRSHGIDILFSHLPDVVALPGVTLTIDWMSVQAFLVNNYLISRHTGFQEIREILPGEQVRPRGSDPSVSRWLWDPVAIASRPHRRTFAETAERLRATAEDCFAAWGADGGDIAVRLSGGLDSTVVTGLARASSAGNITALHMRGRGYETQDLAFARIAAAHAGVELVELDPPDRLFGPSTFARPPLLPRPDTQLLGAQLDAILADACASLNVRSVMTGHGGDSLFLQRGMTEAALTDFVRLDGFGRGFARMLYETATLQQVSVWTVLSRLRKDLLQPKAGLHGRRPSRTADPTKNAFGPAFAEALPDEYLTHPALDRPHKLPPCKSQQLSSLLALRNYHSQLGLGTRFDVLEPLASQPIVELCLQTPAYVFNAGAIDRSLERSAFADLLPPQIARRFQKGFVNHQILHDMQQNIAALREVLHDGQLVAKGMLTGSAIEPLLADDAFVQGRNLSSLLSVLAAELWLQSCLARVA